MPRPLSAPRAPSHRKPSACSGCTLFDKGHGFVPPDGPENASILWMGEAPGFDEVGAGRPFIGAAGSMFERILRRNRLQRGAFRVGNVINCCPPQLQLEGMPWQHAAINHCTIHRDKLLAEPHQVVMAAGATALKTLLNLHGAARIRVEEFHGTVHRDPDDRYWIVPTFHPSFLQRGAHNLIGTVSYDLQIALELVRGQWVRHDLDLIIDPPVEWFRQWVELLEAAVAHDPDGIAVACDIETPDKAGGKPENELTPDDDSYQILRHNFACNGEQGVTVPEHPQYRDLIARVYALPCRHYWWNGYGYDWSRIQVAYPGVLQPLDQLDLMIAAHVLQSDVPLGLGFWAPFYSTYGAWKHLSATDPELYACIDGPQTYRCGVGIIGDLISEGQWRAFQEDCHELYHTALKPAQDIGVLIDREALEHFHLDLAAKQTEKLTALQALVPEALKPLTHETARPPDPGVRHPDARTHTLRGELKKDAPDPIKGDLYAAAVRVSRQVTRTIQTCQTCGAVEVHKAHRCKDATGKIDASRSPLLTLEDRLVTRYFWQEPFNPDSPKQMLAYIKAKGHTPGRAKKTKLESADRETLVRLARATKDPFYPLNLEYRAVKKVDSTYAVPTMRRVDREVAEGREGRLHPIPTFRPSTMRLSYVSPNITNVVQDKGGKASLAAGFRRCVVAAPGCRLLEVDYSGIEAVETGWFSRDPAYIRLARLGVHAFLASHLLGRAADLAWSDADLGAYFQDLKKANPFLYDQAKRCVHGTNYGLTPYGMANTFPDLYPDEKAAARVQRIYFEICPTLPVWHRALQRQAYDAGCLGGPGSVLLGEDNSCYLPTWKGPSPWPHPFQYRHWFWSVLAYKPISEAQRLRRLKAGKASVEINGRWFAVDPGEDSKRCLPKNTKVWMGDYTYKNIQDVRPGETVIGWARGKGAKLPTRGGPDTEYMTRKKRFSTDGLVRARVTGTHQLLDRTVTIHFESGRTLRCTPDHLWLSLNRHEYTYRRADSFTAGDQVCRVDVSDPGSCPEHLKLSAAWLGGFYDGEGSHRGVSQTVDNHGLLQRAEETFRLLGFDTTRQRQHRDHREWKEGCFLGWLGGRQAALKFARWIPSHRYHAQWADRMILGSRFRRLETVVKVVVNPLEEQVYCLTTTTGNFVADDFCSHNCIAFYPQSTASGVLKRTIRALFFDPDHPSYIGDAYYGRTPFRAPIHDSLLLEVPHAQWDRVVRAVTTETLRPIEAQPLPPAWGLGKYLTVGVEAKAGSNWMDVKKIALPGMAELGLSNEGTYFGVEEIDVEDAIELGVVA